MHNRAFVERVSYLFSGMVVLDSQLINHGKLNIEHVLSSWEKQR